MLLNPTFKQHIAASYFRIQNYFHLVAIVLIAAVFMLILKCCKNFLKDMFRPYKNSMQNSII